MRAAYGQCLGGGGWILGHTIDGTQAELVRVPFADTSTYPCPVGVSDEQILMLADILPTGYEVGVRNGQVQPGDVVAVVGAGPIGLAAILGAQLYSPTHIIAIDQADARLEAAKTFGADVVVNNSREDALAVVLELTDGLGADVAIEAVGVPATFELATRLIRPGGHVANIGVHGEAATLHLEDLWSRNVTITTGLVDTYSTPTLLELVRSQQLDPPASSPTSSRSTTWWLPTTPSPTLGRPAPSRCCSPERRDQPGEAPGPPSADHGHLRGHRADPAARDQPCDLRPAN